MFKSRDEIIDNLWNVCIVVFGVPVFFVLLLIILGIANHSIDQQDIICKKNFGDNFSYNNLLRTCVRK